MAGATFAISTAADVMDRDWRLAAPACAAFDTQHHYSFRNCRVGDALSSVDQFDRGSRVPIAADRSA